LRIQRQIATSPRRDSNCGAEAMRAEIQAIVDEIKQSVGLLRRHL
jgi:hypothetical protein